MNDLDLIQKMIHDINQNKGRDIHIMEVCGTHTQSIVTYGIPSLLSPHIHLISGPGCPVCVTDEEYIDAAIRLSEEKDVVIATFGDMVKVPGTKGSLWEQRMKGKSIKVVYSPFAILELAQEYSDKRVVFLGVGFETTAPIIGIVIKEAIRRKQENLFFLTALKRMAPVLHQIIQDEPYAIEGLICPGHVAAIKGADYFRFITEEYGIPAVVCGFEPLDIVGGIYHLVKQVTKEHSLEFLNLYKRVVRNKGNEQAIKVMEEVFQIKDGCWRGIGNIPDSALELQDQYGPWDAKKQFGLHLRMEQVEKTCKCREVLLGKRKPVECDLFAKECTPENPKGPCMISTEGPCGIYYRSAPVNLY